jgi:2-amino-4-hydroxy-6-hydroxymethyldihydropteridine diphosphokinase
LTKAYGYEQQDDFINAVVFVKTSLLPLKLKKIIVNIEDELGRMRTKKKGPHKIDIDILYYNQLNYYSENLTVPRPGITKKAFVLVPLIEVAEQEIFIENINIKKWLQKLNYKSDEVKLYDKFPE